MSNNNPSNQTTPSDNFDLFSEEMINQDRDYSIDPADQPTLESLFGLQRDTGLIDGESRFSAINPFQSFIVQAPAGSGKTALLTQRFLALLSQVDQPEQIVAMTFTKKAAAEMRDRIMGALKTGLLKEPPEQLNDRNTWQLAKAALKKDTEQSWSLLENPNRLRIKTIDGLNSYLVGQMPLLSKMGAQSQISHNVDPAYKEAVHLTLKTPQLEDAVARLLGLVNGRFNRAESLLMNMLKKRDQWMGSLLGFTGDEARTYLEASIQNIVEDELVQQMAVLSHVRPFLEEACEIANYAAQNDQEQLEALCGAWPLSDSIGDISLWRVLADWLLTKDSKGIRKTVNKNNGFIAGKGEAKERKDQFLNVLASLRENPQSKAILEALVILKSLPDPHYTDEQWADLQWLIQLLRVSAAYLKVVFQSTGQADFIEIAQAASQALGSELEPTDLAQQLDYQVRHLLVDEFQDTSSEQYALITKLIAGWQKGDGRTLFIVGDPMQSIYRFREAEVGNFLKAWQGKVGQVALTPVNLQVNFRSSQGLVDWVNSQFRKVLPRENNIEKGAVTYSDSKAFSTDDTPAVSGHWAINRSHETEAEEVVELIKSRLSDFTDGDGKSIALLGRTRSSLIGIARLLKQQGIGFRAVDLEALNERQEVQDGLALSRALLHLSDRAAWIALLRSPLVGLSLNDLYVVMGDRPYDSVWACLMSLESHLDGAISGAIDKVVDDIIDPPPVRNNQSLQNSLSQEGLSRLERVIPVLQQAISRLGSLPFSTLVRETWLQLDGPQTVENHLGLENVDVFCHTLAELDGEALDFQQLETLMDALFARADSAPASQRIELMTMHKSKGLEFDTVILPGLGRKPRADDTELVSWFQFMAEDEQTGGALEQLVIAPIAQKGQSASRLSQLLKRFEAEKQTYELGRLLYVAATRAKQQLHLFGKVDLKESDDLEREIYPVNNSMLSALWPCVSTEFSALEKAFEYAEESAPSRGTRAGGGQDSDDQRCWPKVSRLPLAREGVVQLLESAEKLGNEIAASSALVSSDLMDDSEFLSADPEFAADLDSAENGLLVSHLALLNTSVGNLVHAVFEQMVDEGLSDWDSTKLTERLPFYQQWFTQQGLKEPDLSTAMQRTERSISNAIQNPTLLWALGGGFAISDVEFPLTSIDEHGLVSNHIVDRTLVDEKGIRWIIDYKTSVYEGDDIAGFIKKQVDSYQPQLARYGKLFALLEDRPQKWVIYFSYIDQWVELDQ
ncbi:MAG: ATP-dependent helicase/nuclease subunit A [Thiomicrorhabdus sp.]|nr:MAG: ATP-dependent helicase/nuclease subunit A [Thiomicrorhabdus sp.]